MALLWEQGRQRRQPQRLGETRIAAHILHRVKLGDALTQQRHVGHRHRTVRKPAQYRKLRIEHLWQLRVLTQ